MNRPRRRRLTAPLIAALLLALSTTPLHASHVGEELGEDEQAVQAGDRLYDALRQFEALPAQARRGREAALLQLASARRDRLLKLLERNPRLAVMRVLPPGLRERFPAAVQAQLEQEVEASGTVFAAVADDFERGVSRKEFKLRDAAGALLTLRLGDAAASERDLLGWAGRSVRLRGVRIDGQLLVRDRADVQVVAAAGTATGSGSSTPTITPVVTGDQKTLVILANFSDAPLSCSAADVGSRVFGAAGATVNNGFKESSRDLVSFSGQVVGPFTIPYSAAGSCDYSGWGNAAEAAARAAGVDPSQYRRVSYVTPRNGSCGWSGLAYMPGTRSWVQSCSATGVYTHELGHNLSLHHAATPTAEYGDSSDPMGGARTVRNNAANQVMAGWVPTGGVLDVNGGGAYAVEALGPQAATSPQVLRIAKPDSSEWYYISLRQVGGVDGTLPSNFVNALSVHRATGRLPAKTFLLQTLAVGASFVDSVNGIQVTHQGVAGSTSTVGVTFNGSICERQPPAVTVSPASASAAPGLSASYTVNLSNRNSAACGTASFTLAQTLPGGFSGTLSSPTLTVAAGATASSSWQVSSGIASADGTYTLNLAAAESGGTATTAHAGYTVFRDTLPPLLTVTSPAPGAVLSGRSVSITATASDASGIAAVEFYADGALIGRDTGTPYAATWSLSKAAKGPHALRVRALDKAGNAAEQSLTVTVP